MNPYTRTEVDRYCQGRGLNPSRCEIELKNSTDFRLCDSCSEFMKAQKCLSFFPGENRIIFLNQRRNPRSQAFQHIISRALGYNDIRPASIISCTNPETDNTIFVCVFAQSIESDVDMKQLQRKANDWEAPSARIRTKVHTPSSFSRISFQRSKDRQNRGNWIITLDGVEYFSGSKQQSRVIRPPDRLAEDEAVAALLQCALPPPAPQVIYLNLPFSYGPL